MDRVLEQETWILISFSEFLHNFEVGVKKKIYEF